MIISVERSQMQTSQLDTKNYICSFNREDLNIQTMAINREKNLLVVGGRREFRVLQLLKDKDDKKGGEYAKIDEQIKFSSRKRTSLDYGICDVQWNPSKVHLATNQIRSEGEGNTNSDRVLQQPAQHL